jgi:hypothetical protein
MDSTDIIAYQCSSLVNDRRNNWENGKNLPKRIKTVNQRGCSCKFLFTLKWVVNVCFYIELRQKSGCPFHNSHHRFIEPQNVPIPTRLLTSDQIDNIVHVVNATSNNGAARNYLHGKFGKFINLMKAAYLCRRESGNLQSAKDYIYLMMENLVKSKEISFVSLADVPAKEFTLMVTSIWIHQMLLLSPQPNLFLVMFNVKKLMMNQIFHALLSR